ncbi:MAG: alpha-L-fucosidase, partial [Sediminibacterium sp.]
MKKILFLLLIGSFHFNASAQKKYQADWNSLQQFQIPDWFRDAKFGIYFHWGPYSVPAYDNEWYSINMYIPGTKA